MNFFRRKTTWSNAEFIWLKLCVGSAYLFIGTQFHDFFEQYCLIIISIFSISVIRTLLLWFKKMETGNKK